MNQEGQSWDQLSLDFEKDDLEAIIEVLLFVSSEPITLAQICSIIGGFYSEQEVREVIDRIAHDYEGRSSGLQIIEVANGFRMSTRAQFDHIIRRYRQEKKKIRLSMPALETLAIIAYRQPITTPEIEAIRGVTVSAIVKNLLEKRLIKIVGRKKAVGKPLIYGTTREFLEYFGLSDLSALPTLEEFYETFEGEQPAQLHLEAYLNSDEAGITGLETSEPTGEHQPDSSTDTPAAPSRAEESNDSTEELTGEQPVPGPEEDASGSQNSRNSPFEDERQ
ncbi:SMC-Scp complex subunit ScpB [bacterium]|nr:SMC-Scp complex subunit ScpB [bacterium]